MAIYLGDKELVPENSSLGKHGIVHNNNFIIYNGVVSGDEDIQVAPYFNLYIMPTAYYSVTHQGECVEFGKSPNYAMQAVHPNFPEFPYNDFFKSPYVEHGIVEGADKAPYRKDSFGLDENGKYMIDSSGGHLVSFAVVPNTFAYTAYFAPGDYSLNCLTSRTYSSLNLSVVGSLSLYFTQPDPYITIEDLSLDQVYSPGMLSQLRSYYNWNNFSVETGNLKNLRFYGNRIDNMYMTLESDTVLNNISFYYIKNLEILSNSSSKDFINFSDCRTVAVTELNSTMNLYLDNSSVNFTHVKTSSQFYNAYMKESRFLAYPGKGFSNSKIIDSKVDLLGDDEELTSKIDNCVFSSANLFITDDATLTLQDTRFVDSSEAFLSCYTNIGRNVFFENAALYLSRNALDFGSKKVSYKQGLNFSGTSVLSFREYDNYDVFYRNVSFINNKAILSVLNNRGMNLFNVISTFETMKLVNSASGKHEYNKILSFCSEEWYDFNVNSWQNFSRIELGYDCEFNIKKKMLNVDFITTEYSYTSSSGASVVETYDEVDVIFRGAKASSSTVSFVEFCSWEKSDDITFENIFVEADNLQAPYLSLQGEVGITSYDEDYPCSVRSESLFVYNGLTFYDSNARAAAWLYNDINDCSFNVICSARVEKKDNISTVFGNVQCGYTFKSLNDCNVNFTVNSFLLENAGGYGTVSFTCANSNIVIDGSFILDECRVDNSNIYVGSQEMRSMSTDSTFRNSNIYICTDTELDAFYELGFDSDFIDCNIFCKDMTDDIAGQLVSFSSDDTYIRNCNFIYGDREELHRAKYTI